MAKTKLTSQNIVLLAVVALVAGFSIYFSVPQSIVTNPGGEGTFTLTSIGSGDYRAELTSISDNGRAVLFYQSGSWALLKTPADWDMADLINVYPSTWTVKENRMYLIAGCMQSQVGAVQIARMDRGSGHWSYELAVSRSIGNGCTICPSACSSNAASSTSGYIIFHDSTWQAPVLNLSPPTEPPVIPPVTPPVNGTPPANVTTPAAACQFAGVGCQTLMVIVGIVIVFTIIVIVLARFG